MEFVVLGAIVIAAAVIAVDSVRQHRRVARKPNTRRILARRIQAAGVGPDAQAMAGLSAMLPDTTSLVGGAAAGARRTESRIADDRHGLVGVWRQVRHTSDPDRFKPLLVDGAELVTFRLRWADDYAMVATPDGTTHLRLEPWEAELMGSMDGTRTVAELIVERLREEGDFDAAAVMSLVDLLRMEGLLHPRPVDVPRLIRERLDPASPGRKRLRHFGKTLELHWGGAERFTRAAYRAGFKHAFRPAGLVIVIGVSVLGVVAFLSVLLSGRFEWELRAAPVEAAILLGLGFLTTFVHELGHALVLVHLGRRIPSAGFFVFFGSPAFFVDASDVLMLPARKRILQAAAGPIAELFFASIASILLFAFPEAPFAPLLFRFVIVNGVLLLENLVPLLQLDGYWILADLIQIPDLRQRSLAFLGSDVWHKLKARQRFVRQEIGLLLYGVVGFAYTIFSFWLGFLFWRALFGDIVLSLWRGGFGSRFLLLFLLLFFAGPVIRATIALGRAIGKRVGGIVTRIRFRLERSWRVEAAELIDDLPAFEDLSGDVLSDLAGRVRIRSFPSGRAIFRQGDRPDAFYVIRSGSVTFEENDPATGDTRAIRTVGRGDSFGELGLLGAGARQATARAVDQVRLFEVGKGTFDRLLMDDMKAPDFRPTLQALVELRSLPAFANLSNQQLSDVLNHGGWVVHAPGDTIIGQGDPGDAFYVIRTGQADVDQDGSRINTISAGDHFGELALLDDAPRSASVVARTALRAFRLDREGFEDVIAEGFRPAPTARADRTLEH